MKLDELETLAAGRGDALPRVWIGSHDDPTYVGVTGRPLRELVGPLIERLRAAERRLADDDLPSHSDLCEWHDMDNGDMSPGECTCGWDAWQAARAAMEGA